MEERKEITIDRSAVSRAIRKPLEAYYKAVGPRAVCIYGLHPICKEKTNIRHKEEIASIYAA